MLYRLVLACLGAFLGVMALPGLLMCASVPALADGPPPASAPAPAPERTILQYAAPDGSIGFTDNRQWIVAAVDQATVKPFAPTRDRVTRVDRTAAPHRWYGPHEGYEAAQARAFWGGQAEAADRAVENAETLVDLTHEIGLGETAARRNLRNAEGRRERLEDQCREAGCLPGYLRPR
jgi:hypothetical protein